MITIERHIAEQENLHKDATGMFSRLIRDLTLSIRIISREVRRAGLNDILGMTGTENIHGESVKKLDEFANNTIIQAMQYGGHVCVLASEECDDLIYLPKESNKGNYILLFDPLDGSSNIDADAPIGTIFSILKREPRSELTDGNLDDVLQQGNKQIAAGYALYGSSTVVVLTCGNGVDMFTYDPTLGEFLLSNSNIKMPNKGKYYSINEGNSINWFDSTTNYVKWVKERDVETNRPYSLRYIGTAVGDIHRTLIYGGTFLYPSDKKSPNGKLRLMYEVNPLAFIIEQAGGLAITSTGDRVLDIKPENLHQRCSIICGSIDDVLKANSFI
ncbi:MAG: class 1 fructose-bisphosphatase [Chlorobiota bacterium]|nr:class 1 fructose-bisphosphatase [Chlorobiota bacterium]QQS65512.1 MAG: class 1 fructose-bisphosphatase [Chlorobiota bacterium]